MLAIKLLKTNLTRQTRSVGFLLIILISIFAGFLCAPALGDGYQIFYLNGVRGVYNSAWLGALGALLPSILLWLPGFYLLRSQISEDKRLKIGQVIAATPVSKLRYIMGKALSNFTVLLTLQLVFSLSLVAMQYIRHESLALQMSQYVLPVLFVSVPSLLVLASLTVLFDVVPWLKGSLGNVLIFIMWLILTLVSMEIPGHFLDVFNIGVITSSMAQGAQLVFPNVPGDAGSFGYYAMPADVPTFVWNGLTWSSGFLTSRLVLIFTALVIIAFSVLVFNRFKEKNLSKFVIKQGFHGQKSPVLPVYDTSVYNLSPVTKGKSTWSMVIGEVKVLLAGRSIWWYIGVLLANAAAAAATQQTELKWLACFLLLFLPMWSQMGCGEKMHSTEDIIYSSCSRTAKWLTGWTAALAVTTVLSSGFFIRFAIAAQWGHLISWLVGLLFICTLAQMLGSASGSRHFFEAVFMALFYFGSFSGVSVLDFLGVHGNQSVQFFVITLALIILGLSMTVRRININTKEWGTQGLGIYKNNLTLTKISHQKIKK